MFENISTPKLKISQSACGFLLDDSFGPVVNPCRRSFDFTLLFEQLILTALPAAIFLSIFLPRLWHLHHQDRKIRSRQCMNRSSVHIIYPRPYSVQVTDHKKVVSLIWVGLQLSLIVLWAAHPEKATRASLAASILSFTSVIALWILSRCEYTQSIRPSSQITIYLLYSVASTTVQARTLWLMQGMRTMAGITTTILPLQFVLLILESQSKIHILDKNFGPYPPEAVKDVFNRSTFWWLNTIFLLGFRSEVHMDDLFPIDSALSSQHINSGFHGIWTNVDKTSRRSLLRTSFACLKMPLLSALLPRICLIGFRFAQPFLIQRAIAYVELPLASKNTGYGLIASVAIIYVGIGISTAVSQHKVFRFITMLRGALVGEIYEKSLSINTHDRKDVAAVTLMSTDIDRIAVGMTNILELVASPIEVALALWLLQSQIGLGCIASISATIMSMACGTRIASLMGGRQRVWVQAVQRRIGVTTSVLDSARGVKILGMTNTLSSVIQTYRVSELTSSKPFRRLVVWVNICGTSPILLSPALTFLMFTVLPTHLGGSPVLTAQTAFTSLSLITLLTSPLDILASAFSRFTAALGCFDRIQQYLLLASPHDQQPGKTRSSKQEFRSCVRMGRSSKLYDLEDLKISGSPQLDIIFSLKACTFGVPPEFPAILRDISLNIQRYSVTVILGTAGCGKTTLLKALIGEVEKTAGEIIFPDAGMAYCQQSPWLINSSVRQNIVAESFPFDQYWYDQVIETCALGRDLASLPNGDETVVGSKGSILSGGQKQRIALARAVYAKKPVIILDDILSALDVKTANTILERLLSPQGLLRKSHTTVILATHSSSSLRFADFIVVLDENGRIAEQGNASSMRLQNAKVLELWKNHQKNQLARSDDDTSDLITKVVPASKPVQALPRALKATASLRGRGDFSLYMFYFRSIGWRNMLVTLILVSCYVFCYAFPQIWLQWWTASNGYDNTRYLTVYVILAFASITFLGLFIWYFLVVTVPRSAEQLHHILLSTVMRAPLKFFSRTDTGSIINRFSQDMSLIDMSLPVSSAITLQNALTAVAQAALIAVGAKYVATIIPVCAVLIWLIQKFYLRTSRQIRLLDLEAKSPLYTHFIETLDGLSTIRAFGWQNAFIEKNQALLDASQKPFYLLYCIQRWLNLVLDLLVAGLAIVLMIIAVEVRSSAAGGALGVALVNVLTFNQTLTLLVTSWTQMETSLGAISRVKTLGLEVTPEDVAAEICEPAPSWPTNGAITFANVSACYNPEAKMVLQDVSLSISPGEKIGICGRTGSGKSALLAILTRLLEIERGSVTIDDIDIATIPRHALRASLLALPQDPVLVSGTVRFNLSLRADTSVTSPSDDTMIALLTRVQLWTVILARGGLDAEISVLALSHGQKQLFSLARLLAMAGERTNGVLLLDEVTSNVDLATDRFIHAVIKARFGDFTVITVAHRMETLADSDRIVVLEDGRIVTIGTWTEVNTGTALGSDSGL